jgi:hypothetical protein
VRQKIRNQGWISVGYERRKNRKLKMLIGKNPMPFLEPGYYLSYDMIPPLDPIPDGDYVQLFEDYYPTNWLMKESKIPEQRVAAYFTIKNYWNSKLAVNRLLITYKLIKTNNLSFFTAGPMSKA